MTSQLQNTASHKKEQGQEIIQTEQNLEEWEYRKEIYSNVGRSSF